MGYPGGPQIIPSAGGGGFASMTAIALSADTALDAATHNNHVLEVTTGATDKELTLATTGNTDGDELIIIKADSSAGKVKFAALAGASNLAWLADQYDWLHLHYSGNMGWYVIAQSNIGPRYRSGSYIGPETSATGAATNGSAGWLMFTPIIVRKRVTLAGMGVNVTTAGAAGTYLQLGLWTSKDGMPDALLAQTPYASNQVPGDALGNAYRDFLGGNITIPPGVYWMAVGVSSAAIAVTGVASNGIRPVMTGTIGSTDPAAALTGNTGFSTSSGFTAGSAMPSTPPTSFTGRGNTNAMTAVVKVA